ncbi:MAG: hypothetical protein Q7T49_02385 [bacterium]|nr:hypothetical protein [bacterium]
MQIYKMKSVWRSRTIAILGGLVIFLALFSGFPSWLERPLYFILGLLIVIFGLAGSRPEGVSTPAVTADRQ